MTARGLHQSPQHGELFFRVVEVRDELQRAAAGGLQPQGDAPELVLPGGQGRGGLAVAGAVVEGAGGGKAHGPHLGRPAGDGGHGGDVGGGRSLAIGAPLAHHMHPHRRVGQLGADVDIEPPAAEGVEIVGEAFPVPGQALAEHGEGNVLHPLHQPHQPVVVLRLAGGEADAAIAHDHAGDPMPGRRLHPLVPGGLAVVVGVDVDETGADQLAAGVDLLGAPAVHRADGDDAAVLDPDIGLAAGRARAVHQMAAAHDQIIGVVHGVRFLIAV